MRPPLSYVPAMFPLVGFIAGMLLSEGLVLWEAAGISATGICAVLASRYLPEWSRSIGIFLFFTGVGSIDMQHHKLPDVTDIVNSGKRWWSAEVLDVSENDRGVHIMVRLDSVATAHMAALVHLPHGLASDIMPGNMIRFNGELSVPFNDDAPYAPDYVRILAIRGISATCFSDSIVVEGHKNTWRRYAWNARTWAASLLMRSSLSMDTCSFLMAVLVGDDDFLSEDTRDVFSSSGLAHVLALSGLHVGMVIMVFGFFLFPLGLLWDWRVRCAVVIVGIWLYAFVAGLSASVTRAALMASMVCGGIILQRPYVSMNGMFVAALVILFVAPEQLWTPGFQMSFLAVGSILLIMPVVMPAIERVPRWLRWILAASAISLAAMLGTGMVALYYFHVFPAYFLIANLPVVPVLPVLMIGGLLIMACEAVGFDPTWLCQAVDVVYWSIYHWASVVAGMTSPLSGWHEVHGAALVAYYVTLITGVIALWRRNLVIGAIFVSGIIAICILVRVPGQTDAHPGWFIPKGSYFTTVIFRTNDSSEVSMITNAPPTIAESLRAEYRMKYSAFFESIGAESASLYDGPVAYLPTDSSHPQRCVLVGHDSIVGTPRREFLNADYAVICQGYRGDWQAVVDSLSPRRILLSGDIPKRRHENMYESISSESPVPVISLRGISFKEAGDCL
ncbi:ComEC/Rec2 family competence protein [uncultured Muribaculum sp.]|uniref:ComEC/Rec2 family competence protein n=1 Tax=uncultured Muribaculum sp. TaxID=1918613 RepID=UPI0025FEC09D|nr:ComEC/Rec2 family competence protein [uncultured Muribaculum sp.]